MIVKDMEQAPKCNESPVAERCESSDKKLAVKRGEGMQKKELVIIKRGGAAKKRFGF